MVQKIVPSDVKRQRIPEQREVKAQNEQSMAALQGMLGNVQGIKPRKKPRRA